MESTARNATCVHPASNQAILAHPLMTCNSEARIAAPQDLREVDISEDVQLVIREGRDTERVL